MKEALIELMICPGCLPVEAVLELDRAESAGGEVSAGLLVCSRCGAGYPIENGIARVLPPKMPQPAAGGAGRYEDPAVLSAYLWCHFADLCHDTDASPAYARWARQFSSKGGLALDAGCAAGRFAFELSSGCDLAVGFDRSVSFISKARQILLERRLRFHVPEEGALFGERSFELPARWDSGKVEFIVADAHAVPFRSGVFSKAASLNVIDKIPRPLAHIREIDRVAKGQGAEFLLSDPFSWSIDAAAKEDWLGGLPEGPFAGRGIDNIRRLLTGTRDLSGPPWKIAAEGSVWWKIRNHRNHFELIRSCFIKAVR